MGFFSKVWKGIKTGVKGVVKGVKKAFKSVGKFFGKMGILGQLALTFLIPGFGEMLGKFGGWLSKASNPTWMRSAGTFLETAVKTGNAIVKPFKTLTEGAVGVVTDTLGALGNKLGLEGAVKTLSMGNIDISNMEFSNIGKNVMEKLNAVGGSITDLAKPSDWKMPESFKKGWDSSINKVSENKITSIESFGEGDSRLFDPSSKTKYEETYGGKMVRISTDDSLLGSPPTPEEIQQLGTDELDERGFIRRGIDAAKTKITEAPERLASNASDAIDNTLLTAAGLREKPQVTYESTQYVTTVPEFTPFRSAANQFNIASALNMGYPDLNASLEGGNFRKIAEMFSSRPYGAGAHAYAYARGVG